MDDPTDRASPSAQVQVSEPRAERREEHGEPRSFPGRVSLRSRLNVQYILTLFATLPTRSCRGGGSAERPIGTPLDGVPPIAPDRARRDPLVAIFEPRRQTLSGKTHCEQFARGVEQGTSIEPWGRPVRRSRRNGTVLAPGRPLFAPVDLPSVGWPPADRNRSCRVEREGRTAVFRLRALAIGSFPFR
jgi:diadenosine tetraphosphatase ApaH/serine/threonine PP2A family protein phosphatase